jgi:hypothetical protein
MKVTPAWAGDDGDRDVERALVVHGDDGGSASRNVLGTSHVERQPPSERSAGEEVGRALEPADGRGDGQLAEGRTGSHGGLEHVGDRARPVEDHLAEVDAELLPEREPELDEGERVEPEVREPRLRRDRAGLAVGQLPDQRERTIRAPMTRHRPECTLCRAPGFGEGRC